MSDDGSRIIVGSDASGTDFGYVAVYHDDQAGSWVLVNAMIPGMASGDHFGMKVGISANGSRVIVGAHLSHAGGTRSGEVAVFEDNVSNSSWVLVHNQRIPGKAANDIFGFSVDLSSNGSRIVACAASHDSNGLTNNGECTIYDDDGSGWVPVHGSISGLGSGDNFGIAAKLSADGNRVVVGANGSNAAAGQVRVFDDNMSEWEQVGNELNGNTSNDRFAWVGMSDSGKRIIVGARFGGGGPGGGGPGEVRVFEK